jgi:hypothetical protein
VYWWAVAEVRNRAVPGLALGVETVGLGGRFVGMVRQGLARFG